MRDLERRLGKAELVYFNKKDLFATTPFDDWTNSELNLYIKKHAEIEYEKKNIKSIVDAEKYYKEQHSSGTITQQEKEINIDTAKAYFNGELT